MIVTVCEAWRDVIEAKSAGLRLPCLQSLGKFSRTGGLKVRQVSQVRIARRKNARYSFVLEQRALSCEKPFSL
jgi:hypothetical protein